MKIGVELYQIREGKTGGLVPFLRGLLDALLRLGPEHELILFCIEGNERLFDSLPGTAHVLPLPPASYFLLLDAHASHLRLDVLFRSYPLVAELMFPLARQVVLIPDIQHEHFPEFFNAETLQGRSAAFAEALRDAGAVVTLSEHARQTLLAHPECRTEVLVTSPALSTDEGEPGAELTAEERALLPLGDYFFFPANLWPHKNHRRTLQAFELFSKRTSRRCQFVLTGHPAGWEALAAEFPGLPVRHLGFVRQPLLRELLRRALALSFFSLFEGFGIPLLEAFQAGTPVICSNTTSLPEVGGDAVLACDPTDVHAMSNAMMRIAEDHDLRQELVARGRVRLSRYRWEDSARQLLEACQQVVCVAKEPADFGLETIGRLNKWLQAIEADREARLDVIHKLEVLLAESRAVHLDAITCLNRESSESSLRLEAIHRLDSLLKESEADRAAQHTLMHQMYAELHSTRALCRRLLHKVLAKARNVTGLGRKAA